MTDNPYAAPKAEVEAGLGGDPAQAESIRNTHLSHEASVRGLGALYVLGSMFGLVACLAAIVGGLTGSEDTIAGVVGGLVLGAFCALQLWVGLGLRKLQPAVRIPAVVLSCVGLVGFPIGTLLSAYFLYLLLSAKGKLVFSEAYAEVRAQTPHIVYKTSIVVWIFVAIFVGLVLLGGVGFLVG